MVQKSIGPKVLFWGTLSIAVAIGALSFFYYRAVSRLEIESQTIAQIKTEYENRIQELQKNLVVEQTKTVKVPSQVVTQNCGPRIGGLIDLGDICIPVTKTIQQDVQQVVKVEDPKVRAELNATLARLQTLSSESQNAKSLIDDITPYYEFTQKMMKPVISIIVLIVSLIIILSQRYNSDQEKWAFGSLGTIIGVWLK